MKLCVVCRRSIVFSNRLQPDSSFAALTTLKQGELVLMLHYDAVSRIFYAITERGESVVCSWFFDSAMASSFSDWFEELS